MMVFSLGERGGLEGRALVLDGEWDIGGRGRLLYVEERRGGSHGEKW